MYILIWDDWEGVRHEMEFFSLDDAELEAIYLRDMYDGVEIRYTAPR